MKNGVFLGAIIAMFLWGDGLSVELKQRDGRVPVTQEWRQAMAHEFNTNASFMKKIIMAGEDAEQLPDFSQRFNDQDAWFDNVLRGTQYEHDKNYRQVVQKQEKLRTIVEAQKKAETDLAAISKNMKLTDEEKKKVRLLLLYELNAVAQKNGYNVELTDQLIKDLVFLVVAKAPGRVQLPIVQHSVDASGYLSEQIKIFKKKSEEQVKQLLEQQILAKHLEEELLLIGKKGQSLNRVKKECGLKIEEKEKQCLDLSLELIGVKEKLDACGKQLTEKRLLKDQACEKVKLVEELSDRCINEYRGAIKKLRE